MPLRVLLFVAALALIHPGTVTDILGLALGVPSYLWQRYRFRQASAFFLRPSAIDSDSRLLARIGFISKPYRGILANET